MPYNNRLDALPIDETDLAQLDADARNRLSHQAKRWEDSCVVAYHAMQRHGFQANVYPRILTVSLPRGNRIGRIPRATLDICRPAGPEETEATIRKSAAEDYACFLGLGMRKRPNEVPDAFPTVRFDPERTALVIERQTAND